jgi:thioesterase domain-containing protein
VNVPELENYLYEHIPLTRAMGVQVVQANTTLVLLAAPLAPNINHRQTAFGGSIASVATVAAWSLLRLVLASDPQYPHIVVRSTEVEYIEAITGDFTARCEAPIPHTMDAFLKSLHRKGKARIDLRATVDQGGRTRATFCGTFVALYSDTP